MKQASLVLQEQAPIEREPTVMEMMSQALASGMPGAEMAHVIKELALVRQSEERFAWEREERQARLQFDEALNNCQSQIERIIPNQDRENGIKWADYIHIDKAIRPLYTKAGFSVAFSEEPGEGDRLRMKAIVSKGGVSKEFFAEITRTPSNSKMSKVDADAAAASRVKRYLMLDIFNIAVGIDKDEKIGLLSPEQGDALQQLVKQMEASATREDGLEAYRKAYKMARELKNNEATLHVIDVWEKCQAGFAEAR
jgi:hypothetical protein